MSEPQIGGRNSPEIPKHVMARIYRIALLAPSILTLLCCLLIPRQAYHFAMAAGFVNFLLILSSSPFCAWWLARNSSRNSAARILTSIIFFLALVGGNLILLFIAFVNVFGVRM
jgi:hypothetical protein